MSKALKRGNTVKCAFWRDGFAVKVTAVGDEMFLGYRVEDGQTLKYEESFMINPDPGKMFKKETREWILA